MAATAVTFAGLFGADSRVTVEGENHLDDKMEFAFASISMVAVLGMGTRGTEYQLSGVLRGGTASTLAGAVDNFNALLTVGAGTGIVDYKDKATLLTFAGDSSSLAAMFKGTAGAQLTNVIISTFSVGPRRFSREGSNWRINAPFTMILKRLV